MVVFALEIIALSAVAYRKELVGFFQIQKYYEMRKNICLISLTCVQQWVEGTLVIIFSIKDVAHLLG